MRMAGGEIRQQYIYFASPANPDIRLIACDEGQTMWIDAAGLLSLPMPVTNAACLEHYLHTGKNDDLFYLLAMDAQDRSPKTVFTPLRDIVTSY